MTTSDGRFSSRYLSTWSPDRLYRVCLVEDEMYFIWISGQGEMGSAVAHQFGLVGALVWRFIAKRREDKQESLLEQFDSQHPSELLSIHKHNFRCSVRDVVGSSFEPPSRFAGHGPHFGRWILHIAGQKPMTFQFEALEDMQEASRRLPAILGARFVVKTKWDPISNRFVKL